MRAVTESLREFTYMADCAKLSFNLNIIRDNVDLKWSGFNDSLLNFVTQTLEKINQFKDADCREIFE